MELMLLQNPSLDFICDSTGNIELWQHKAGKDKKTTWSLSFLLFINSSVPWIQEKNDNTNSVHFYMMVLTKNRCNQNAALIDQEPLFCLRSVCDWLIWD